MKIQTTDTQRAPATEKRSQVACQTQLVPVAPGSRSFSAPCGGQDFESRWDSEVAGGLEQLARRVLATLGGPATLGDPVTLGGPVTLGIQSKTRCIVDNIRDGGVSMACAAEASVKFLPRGTMSSLARRSGWAMVFSGHAVEHFLRR